MKFMSISEIEASAIGTPTGYCDRFGTPIKVGDEIIYYHRCTRELEPDEDLSDFERYEIVGGGHKGYVYTGRVNRYRSVVTFSFEYGLRYGDDNRNDRRKHRNKHHRADFRRFKHRDNN